MGTTSRAPARIAARAAFVLALVFAIAALGCSPPADPACVEVPSAKSAAPGTSASARATAPGGSAEARAAEARDAPGITVTVANAGDEHVIAIDAVHGSLDEPIVLIAATPSAAPPDAAPAMAKERVEVALTEAFAGGEAPVPLRLIDPVTGADVAAVEIAQGQHAYLRIAGEGFTREATYRANLTIFGAEPAVYRVRVRSTAPHRPLGLRAQKWADTFANVPIFERKAVSVILPVDSVGENRGPYHVLVKQAAEPVDGVKPLPACGIVARASGRDDAIVLELPALEPGRYAGVIEIQGEPLAVDITEKNSFWWVWALVAAGAGLSLGLREYVRYRAAREAMERKIATKERELDKKADGLLAWDELCARNVLRLARGRNSYLGLDDIEEILPDATPRERPERLAIDKALSETELPPPLRAKLRARLERLSYRSSRFEAAEVDRGLADLARAAQAGFSAELQAWLSEQQEAFAGVEARIAPLLMRESMRADAVGTARVHAAMRVLGSLIEDARALALDAGLVPGQGEVLSNLGPALAQIEAWVREERAPLELTDLIHCSFSAVAHAREASEKTPAREAADAPEGLRPRVRGVGVALNAHEEITFEVVGAQGELGAAAVHEPAQPVVWIIDGEEVVAHGGARLTFVFESARLAGLGLRHVVARSQSRTLAEWHVQIRRPERRRAVVERLWSSGARFAATLVGVILAGAAAVGLFWSGKPFGSGSDYVGALLTGLGADLTVVAGGGKLLQTMLETFTKRREDE